MQTLARALVFVVPSPPTTALHRQMSSLHRPPINTATSGLLCDDLVPITFQVWDKSGAVTVNKSANSIITSPILFDIM
ncbi:hypothetical protein BC826DRAFT_1060792 [Russula brevipes]|nr:hypothetical protein BC826DRAFT_1060792 [Russula brevipes]